jgi:hypothetical protein
MAGKCPTPLELTSVCSSYPQSRGNQCGPSLGACSKGNCCSKYGFCGSIGAENADLYCSQSLGCQLGWGACFGSATNFCPSQPTNVTGATTLVLLNDVPSTTTIPGPNGAPVGTVSIHEAILRSSEGNAVGTFHVVVTTVDVSPGDVTESRMRNVAFYFKDGQILATGIGLYPTSETYLEAQAPHRIAIVGGTGKYLGARGEVTTTRSTDGTYRHVLTLLQ